MMDVIMTHHETKDKNIMDRHGQQIQINVHFSLTIKTIDLAFLASCKIKIISKDSSLHIAIPTSHPTESPCSAATTGKAPTPTSTGLRDTGET